MEMLIHANEIEDYIALSIRLKAMSENTLYCHKMKVHH